MADNEIDPDAPEPNDWTMRRLEAVESFDQWFPQWLFVDASCRH